ncbi:Major Facilitator Superfamily protein [Pseudoalteromonas sp. THAF3]|uniref:organoarsenical effux MFS transporter ArsJ n=1 Tax=Pseudoalteromonas sp. THAF3 TaxID=2587843 RepID=UPI001268509C|nr:organoarsenical effux MFS transporter ArsJ [Pseudoalteromonas sp. THAF3]QFU05068.1 Major Facilitator Superfamily protein [Pseudoalteromonas sp. THAF3]
MNTSPIQQYGVITANYWAFTLSDGALRMLVVLYFYQLGYAPLAIAMLFLFYEFFGVVTNLVGGWLGARIGLNRTMQIGMGLQLIALAMLLVDNSWLSVPWVMAAQALSGIAKDLNKMSAKSAIKTVVSDTQQGRLYRWIALLTGSKNALKGAGYFAGGALLSLLGFSGAVIALMVVVGAGFILSALLLGEDLGRSKFKPKFRQLFSKNAALNRLAAARMLLFASRDVWFVVALPVFFISELGWQHTEVGSFMALWIIGYGVVQSIAPRLSRHARVSVFHQATAFSALLTLTTALLIAVWLLFATTQSVQNIVLVVGLLCFGAVFAVNSSLHSYLVVKLADRDAVSLDVGFYYMANAMGRLIGTVLSGWLYQQSGLLACLVSALLMQIATWWVTRKIA